MSLKMTSKMVGLDLPIWCFFLFLRFPAIPDGLREALDLQKSEKIIKNDIKFLRAFNRRRPICHDMFLHAWTSQSISSLEMHKKAASLAHCTRSVQNTKKPYEHRRLQRLHPLQPVPILSIPNPTVQHNIDLT